MKKMLIAVIILVILSAGSLTAFFIFKNRQDKKSAEKAEQAADYELFSFDSDLINKVSFSCPDGNYTAELSDGEWVLADSDEFTLNPSYVQNVCTYMSTLTAETDFGEADDEKKAMYGLDEPIVITATDGTSEYTVYVGDPSPTGDVYYVMTDGKSKVYAIDTLYGSVLKTSRLMMKDKHIVPYDDNEIERIQVLKDGETVYDLSHNSEDDTWSLSDEYSLLAIDKTEVTSMINIMTRIEVINFYDENLGDYSKYGFDQPVAELIVTGSDGKTYKRLFSYFGKDSSTYSYVLFEESGQVATYYKGDVDFIEDIPLEFLVKEICFVNSSDITGFDFTYSGRTDVFSLNNDDGTVMANGVSVSDAGSEAVTAYSNFFTALTGIEIESTDVSVSPEKSEPLLCAVYHFSDGTDKTLELCDTGDGESFYAFINGSYSGAIVSTDDITGKNSVSQFYDELTGLIG